MYKLEYVPFGSTRIRSVKGSFTAVQVQEYQQSHCGLCWRVIPV